MRTAFEITKIFHGEEGADKAQEKFVKLVQNKEPTENMPEVSVGADPISLFALVRKCLDSSQSNSQIRHLISQNAVKINSEVINDLNQELSIPETGLMFTVGKKKWFRILR